MREQRTGGYGYGMANKTSCQVTNIFRHCYIRIYRHKATYSRFTGTKTCGLGACACGGLCGYNRCLLTALVGLYRSMCGASGV